jgi:hypothetical protein
MFGGSYKWSLIKEQSHYYHVMKYVFLNPVKAKIVHKTEHFGFSTLFVQKNNIFFPIPLKQWINILDKIFFNWLDECHSVVQRTSITKGLESMVFNFSGSREKRKPPQFEILDWSAGT